MHELTRDVSVTAAVLGSEQRADLALPHDHKQTTQGFCTADSAVFRGPVSISETRCTWLVAHSLAIVPAPDDG
jgi:hypothetical protein